MKTKKQMAAVMLSFMLVITAIRGQFTDGTRADAAGYGINNPVINSEGVTTWDCIWFGFYRQSGKAVKEAIKWRVLSVKGDDAFLLADQNLDCRRYHAESLEVTWEICSLRKWLNNNFYQNAFSSAEQAAIQTTSVENEENPYYKTGSGKDTLDKVYLLSIAEASDPAYGFHAVFNENSESRCAKNTDYTRGNGAFSSSVENYNNNGLWWLRSSGANLYSAANVSDVGYGAADGGNVALYNRAVRPALHIKLSSSVWSKAGTVNSLGKSEGDGNRPEPIEIKDSPVVPSTPSDSNNNNSNAGLKDSAGASYKLVNSGSSKKEVSYTAPKNKKITSAAIPAAVTIGGVRYQVTSIKANAFKNCKKLKKVTIGKNVKTIGKNAFYGCTKLSSITIKTTKLTGSSVKSNAFAKLHKKAKFKVPKKKLSTYKKLLKKKGVTGKKQVIKV